MHTQADTTTQTRTDTPSVEYIIVKYFRDNPADVLTQLLSRLDVDFKDFGVDADLSPSGAKGLLFRTYDPEPATRVKALRDKLVKLDASKPDAGLQALLIVLASAEETRSNNFSAPRDFVGVKFGGSLSHRLLLTIVCMACPQQYTRDYMSELIPEALSRNSFLSCLKLKINHARGLHDPATVSTNRGVASVEAAPVTWTDGTDHAPTQPPSRSESWGMRSTVGPG